MKICRHALLLAVPLLLLSFETLSQSARLRAANKQFENMSYVNAVRMYEEFVRLDKRKDPVELQEALTKLGYSYRKLQDSRNAERVYGELINSFADVPSENYLYYAQALASNKKHREAQRMYAKYGEMQREDLRGRRFAVSYMDVNRFYQDSSSYRVEYLPINSRQADFSPMFYNKGLVFVSARDESGVTKRVFSWNQTPFLDLYFHPDTTELQGTVEVSDVTASLGGGDVNDPQSEAAPQQKLSKTEVFSRTLNTKYHEGPMTFFKDQQRIIFTRNNDDRGRSGKSDEGVRKLKLFYAELGANGGKWTNIKELPFNSKDYSTGHPALAPDDSKLYFVSDMPGGYGGTDLYVVEYNEGEWGTPMNMGREINTEGNELFPFMDANGTLYFASDGHEGIGGLDVFSVTFENGYPTPNGVRNMGYPINSERDDFGLIVDPSGYNGYLSSNRKKGASDDNLYRFRKLCKELNVFVYDAQTKQPIEGADLRVVKGGVNQQLQQTKDDGSVALCLDAAVAYEFRAVKEGYAANSIQFSTLTQATNPKVGLSIYLDKSENSLVRGVVVKEVDNQPAEGVKVTLQNEKTNAKKVITTGPDGGYEFDMEPNSNYTISTEKDRYTTEKSQIKTKKNGGVVDQKLGIYGEGDVFILKNIYYNFDRFDIRKDAVGDLNKVVALMKKYPTMVIELRSHTDSRANDAYNQTLSDRRAQSAVDYIVKRGISRSRLVAKGYGESELLNDCADGVPCSEAEHQLNRRTEFKILKVQ